MAAVTSLAYNSSINQSILGVEILILAPPGYGKRSFLLRNRHREPFCDFHLAQDVLKYPPNHYYGVACDVPNLIQKASISFVYLPPKEIFFAACSHHGVQDIEDYYHQFLQAARVATYVITSGDTLLFYQRFMEKAINHYFEGEPVVPLPNLTPSYAADPVYPVYSEMLSVTPTSEERSSDMSLCSTTEPQQSDSLLSSYSAASSSDPDVRHGPLPSSVASSLLAAVSDYKDTFTINEDIETADCQPTQIHHSISQRFAQVFNILSVPVVVGIPTERGTVHVKYFGGNFLRMGSIYMSLLVLCKKRFDNGTVQFSPPDWLIP